MIEEREQYVDLPAMHRLAEAQAVDAQARTFEASWGAGAQVRRYDFWRDEAWIEELDMSPDAVDLSRLNGGAPLLDTHRIYGLDSVLGVVERAWLEDGRGMAKIRLSTHESVDPVAHKVAERVIRNLSIGYEVQQFKEVGRDKESGLRVMRATRWAPFEISLVPVGADASAQTRGNEQQQARVTRCLVSLSPAARAAFQEESTMTQQQNPAAGTEAQAPQTNVDIKLVENAARDAERERVKSLDALGRQFKEKGGEDLARQCIAEGKSLSDLQSMLLERVGTKVTPTTGEIGMSERERRSFSIVRLVNALAQPENKAARSAAAFEFEASEAALRVENRSLRGGAQVVIPYDVLAHAGRRDLIVATSTMGGYTVGTDTLGASFVDLLKNKTFAIQAGATVLSGLQGMVAIPTLATSATAYWVAENTAPTEGAMNFGQLTMTPKMLGAWVDVSRRLLIQSSIDVENFVRGELASQIAVELDRAILNGAGTGSEPLGILAATTVGTTTAGANGAAPTWQHMVDLETLVANNNADRGAMGYFVNSKVRGKLKTVVKSTSAVAGFIWDNTDMPVNGYRTFVTNNVPSTLTKGTSTAICSAAIFGAWQDVVLGQWGGGVDLQVDPYTGSSAGTLRIVALTDVDVLIRRPGSFAYIKDLLTT
jgi:HK97 family phage major capsid protein